MVARASNPLPGRPLVLSGFMGTGKSTLGARVAGLAGAPFVDLDGLVEAEAGVPVQSIFQEQGEAAFRSLERKSLLGVLDRGGSPVIAAGGGALLDAELRRAIGARTTILNLVASPEGIEGRTRGPGRPLLEAAGEGKSERLVRIAELLEARASAYADADDWLRTEGRSEAALAEALLRAWRDRIVRVRLPEGGYAVRISGEAEEVAADLVARLAPSAALMVTDETVARLWAPGVEAALVRAGVEVRAKVVLPPGEAAKHLGSLGQALEAFVAAGADRDAVVVGLGGGVACDLAGFVAATLLRGVRWVAVPTTLLAMVDASVGGKTGVDVGPAKNAAGAFWQPTGVVAGPAFVATEPERQFRSGLAEVVKAGCLADSGLVDLLERKTEAVLARDPGLVAELVERSVEVKARIVEQDPRERGLRAVLNFGHTLGHALEAAGGFSRLLHGEAVSLGMVAMLRAGRRLGETDAGTEARIVGLLGRLGLPTALEPGALAEAAPFLALDKKRTGGGVRVVLLRRLGEPRIVRLGLEQIEELVAAP